jgi:hypothetical protein
MMADDLAMLGLAVDSRQVTQADAALDKFAAAAKTADTAAQGFKAGAAGATSATAMLAQNLAATQQQAARLNPAFQQVNRNAALSTSAMANLSFQINDVATMAAMGAAPLQILATQAGQFYQILAQGEGGVRGSLGFLKDTLIGLVTPARLATAGIAAIGTTAFIAANSWRNAQDDIRLGLLGIGSAAGVTAQDINRIALAAAQSGQMTVGSAREMALALASTGNVSTEIIEGAVASGRNLAKVFGETTTEAAERLARALVDPGKGLDELDRRLAGFDDRTVQHIRSLAAQNRALEYQRIIIDGVRDATRGAEQVMGGWGAAWNRIAETSSQLWDQWSRSAALKLGFGQIEDRIEKLRTEIEGLRTSWMGWGATLNSINIDIKTRELERLTSIVEHFNATFRENRDSRALGSLVRGIVPEGAELREMEDRLARLRSLASGQALERLDPNTQLVTPRAIGILEAQIAAHRTNVELAREEHAIEMRRIAARTASELAEIERDETRLRLMRTGRFTGGEANTAADLAATRILAQERERIARAQEAQLLSARQATTLAGLELSLVGQTSAVQERARAALEVRQQVESEALRLYGDRNAFDQRHLDALTQEAMRNVEINRLMKERQLMLDIQFERDQLGRTSREQGVYARLQAAGMLTNGEIQGSAAEAAAAQLRLNNILQTNIDMSREFTSSLVRDLLAGRDATEALSNALLRLADRFADLALDHAFQALMGGKGGGNSWLASLWGGGGTGGWTTTVNAFHRGGVVGADDNGMTRTVHPAVFAGAKRYHSGGIAGLAADEVPAILQRGERVIPRGGSGGIVVNVPIEINAANASHESIAELKGSVAELQRQLPSVIVRTIQQATDRRIA